MSNEVRATPEQEASIRALFDANPNEVPAVRDALMAGYIYGRDFYDRDGCGCLIGTIYSASHPGAYRSTVRWNAHAEAQMLRGEYWGAPSCCGTPLPAESYVVGIVPGDTPDNSPRCAELLRIIDTWIGEHVGAPEPELQPVNAGLTESGRVS